MPFDRRIPLVVYALALVYLWQFADRGWIPHDDGMLAQVAERVAAGELPHRDFDDPYTGLLGYLHAVGLIAFGTSVRSLRLVLFVSTAAWLPAVYRLARRFASPPGAMLVTALALAWSVPNYFAGIPSYYNVYLATFGTLALVRHAESGRRSWVWLAGACAGLSFLIKSAGGIYFGAAAFLFLVYREGVTRRAGRAVDPGRAALSRLLEPMLLAKALGAVAVAAGLARLSPRLGGMEVLHFVLPGTLAALALCRDEAARGAAPLGPRIGRLWHLLWPFGAGCALPVLAFLVPYAWSGALDDFVTGVFVVPARRFESASYPLPPHESLWPAVLAAIVILHAAMRAKRLSLQSALGLTVVGVLALLVASAGRPAVYQALWSSARHLGVFAVAAGYGLLASHASLGTIDRQRLFLVVAVAAFMTLLQVPFAAPVYFAYSAPFVVLGLTAIASAHGVGTLHGLVAGAYLLFAVSWLNPSYVWALGVEYRPYEFVGASWVRRAGITMLPHEAEEYSRLMQLVEKVQPTRPMLALPDCPEVYFLSARPNPTRYTYEFLSPRPFDGRLVLGLVDQHEVGVIVVNREPHFSPALDAGVLDELERRFPYSAETGRFLVRWRL